MRKRRFIPPAHGLTDLTAAVAFVALVCFLLPARYINYNGLTDYFDIGNQS